MKYNKQSGFTILFGLLVATAVSLLGVGVVSISNQQIKLSQSSERNQDAYYSADTGIECMLYQIRQNDAFGSGSLGSCGGVSLSQTSSSESGYEYLVVVPASSGCAQVHIDTDYSANTLRVLSKGYNSCDGSGPIAGDPDLQEINLVVDYESSGTGFDLGSNISNVGVGGSHNAVVIGYDPDYFYTGNSQGLYIYDVSDPGTAFYDRRVPFTTQNPAISRKDNYVYMNSGTRGWDFRTYDVTDPRYPALVDTKTDFKIRELVPYGTDYLIAGGGYGSDTRGLRVIDVSDPADPQMIWISDYGVGSRLIVSGTTAFSSGTTGFDFYAFDISDPTAPVQMHYNAAGYGMTIAAKGDYMYTWNSPTSTVGIYDISDLSSITKIKDVFSGLDIGIVPGTVDGDYLYTGTTQYNHMIYKIDIGTDPLNPAIIGSYDFGTDGYIAYDFAIGDGYVASVTGNGNTFVFNTLDDVSINYGDQ